MKTATAIAVPRPPFTRRILSRESIVFSDRLVYRVMGFFEEPGSLRSMARRGSADAAGASGRDLRGRGEHAAFRSRRWAIRWFRQRSLLDRAQRVGDRRRRDAAKIAACGSA